MYPQPYQDLLDLIESNPEYLHDLRVQLLSPEIIALPKRFAQMVSLVAELSTRLSALEDHAVETIRQLTTLETNVTALVGNYIECRIYNSILNLTRGSSILAHGRDTAPALLESITVAEENGLITDQQADNVLVADIIIRARRADDKQYVHAVFEVSRTIRLSDIQRSYDSATTVAAATNENTIAAMKGSAPRLVNGDRVEPELKGEPDGYARFLHRHDTVGRLRRVDGETSSELCGFGDNRPAVRYRFQGGQKQLQSDR